MTKEERELLLKDLSARLPYGVIVQYKGHNSIVKNKLLTGSDLDCNMEYYKPYLRPISSMTEDEFKELKKIHENQSICSYHTISMDLEFINWYLAHHFDINYLIQSGLAIEVTKENNPYKE